MDTNTSLQQDAQAQCVECGNAFSINDMIRHGSAYICVSCKPRFMQKLAEGADIHVGLRYAGFWLRFVAQFLDSLLLGIVNFGIQLVALRSMLPTLSGDTVAVPSTTPLLISYGLSFLIAITYEGMMVGKYGATLGKMACKLKVVKPDGTPVSYGRAFGRYFARWLSVLTLLIGYIIAAFDSEKRSLHDRVCNTRVVITN
jgi:uncharacterized RDD family membrane protein YckC